MNSEQIVSQLAELEKMKKSAENLLEAHSLCDEDDDDCDHSPQALAEAYGIIKATSKALNIIQTLLEKSIGISMTFSQLAQTRTNLIGRHIAFEITHLEKVDYQCVDLSLFNDGYSFDAKDKVILLHEDFIAKEIDKCP